MLVMNPTVVQRTVQPAVDVTTGVAQEGVRCAPAVPEDKSDISGITFAPLPEAVETEIAAQPLAGTIEAPVVGEDEVTSEISTAGSPILSGLSGNLDIYDEVPADQRKDLTDSDHGSHRVHLYNTERMRVT